MAKSTTSKNSGKGSGGKAGGTRKPVAKARPRSGGDSGGNSGSAKKSGGSAQTSAADALLKLLESPLVAEILAIGASAALATLAAQRFGRSEDGKGTRRALKSAAKAAAAAMGQRLASEVEEIRKASKPKPDEAA